MTKPVYVLGTGLSHNGSAILLKDGVVAVGIEKERLTRKKHDGGNDTLAIEYCLEAEGITLEQVDLVVQCANFEVPERTRYKGPRLLAGSDHPPLVSISHHLAHAYSAAGTCPFNDCNIMVIDGCGSPDYQCTELNDLSVLFMYALDEGPANWEKDSYYHFDGQQLIPLYKDFSGWGGCDDREAMTLPVTRHSIGGFYAAVSHYVFGNMDDVGKLMGLAPYGRAGQFSNPALYLEGGRVFLDEQWKEGFDRPASSLSDMKEDFQYYADVAHWAQAQVEQAVEACIQARLARYPHRNLCYSGGVALNAVANARLLSQDYVDNLYIEPAAGDNGLALGCAFYGWLRVLNRERVLHDQSTCFGRSYASSDLEFLLAGVNADEVTVNHLPDQSQRQRLIVSALSEGQTVGWFCCGSEFGPRALGRRSILAHPGVPGLKAHINRAIKFREDFRPFAPAVLKCDVAKYFEAGRPSPYMILVDRTRPEWRTELQNVTHVDGTARVQTVDAQWNPEFAALLNAFQEYTGLGVLLNTSLNRKGMPMVETPQQAVHLFLETALDMLVLDNYVLVKPRTVTS